MTEIWTASSVRFATTIKNASDVLVDPTTLQIEITDPQGTVTTYIYGTDAELVKSSTGSYYADMTISSLAGTWSWKWSSTGVGAGADYGEFEVLA